MKRDGCKTNESKGDSDKNMSTTNDDWSDSDNDNDDNDTVTDSSNGDDEKDSYSDTLSSNIKSTPLEFDSIYDIHNDKTNTNNIIAKIDNDYSILFKLNSVFTFCVVELVTNSLLKYFLYKNEYDFV